MSMAVVGDTVVSLETITREGPAEPETPGPGPVADAFVQSVTDHDVLPLLHQVGATLATHVDMCADPRSVPGLTKSLFDVVDRLTAAGAYRPQADDNPLSRAIRAVS